MNCPHCNFPFRAFAVANADEMPSLAPIICEGCAAISLLVNGTVRKATPEELRAIQQSPAYREVLAPVADLIRGSVAPPVDRDNVSLVGGKPVTDDYRELKPDGMQKEYLVLSNEERRKGFVRPYRDSYTHRVCGTNTKMNYEIAETYARDPKFYGATYCVKCRSHFPLDQFIWEGTDLQVGS